jgi:hypothetical protein
VTRRLCALVDAAVGDDVNAIAIGLASAVGLAAAVRGARAAAPSHRRHRENGQGDEKFLTAK